MPGNIKFWMRDADKDAGFMSDGLVSGEEVFSLPRNLWALLQVAHCKRLIITEMSSFNF